MSLNFYALRHLIIQLTITWYNKYCRRVAPSQLECRTCVTDDRSIAEKFPFIAHNVSVATKTVY